jgi:hypothetical protein
VAEDQHMHCDSHLREAVDNAITAVLTRATSPDELHRELVKLDRWLGWLGMACETGRERIAWHLDQRN